MLRTEAANKNLERPAGWRSWIFVSTKVNPVRLRFSLARHPGRALIHSAMIRLLSFLSLAALAPTANAAPPVLDAELTESGALVRIDGKLFTEYVGKGAQRPYLYPIIGPSGANLTRPYPMAEGGAKDHPHHRSFWFAHGAVNGIDFWADGEKHGRQEHQSVSDLRVAGNQVSFATTTRCVDKAGKPVYDDRRLIAIEAREDGSRVVDFTIHLQAAHGPLVFGDTKEGTFALRLCPSLTIDGDDGHGAMLSSTGKKDGAVWGKQAEWVSAFGPDPKGERVTITIFDHPANLRHPTWWHARTYGLFAANPFGKHDFEKLEDKSAGDHKLDSGGVLTLRYRVLIQAGEPDQAKLRSEFAAFSATEAK